MSRRVATAAGEQSGEAPAESRTTPEAHVDRPVDRERVARLAYERFEMRGRVHGLDQEDWYEAERALTDRVSEPPQD